MTKTDRLTQLFGKQIAQGKFKAGAALPSEAELCERFDVSRNVLREVIKVLSTKKLIDAQPHRGLFVMPQAQWNYLDADVLEWALEKGGNPDLLNSLIEVRSLIEPTISRWAAERATAVDLVAIEGNYNAMVANRTNFQAFQEADIGFHRAILVATHNVVIQQLSDAVSALQRAIFDLTYLADKRHMDLTMKEHAELSDAIRRKNAQAAELACHQLVVRTAWRARVKPDGGTLPAAKAKLSSSEKVKPKSRKSISKGVPGRAVDSAN
jgi:GntR family transcriptional regulator, galactonate operon transcriptional repressor